MSQSVTLAGKGNQYQTVSETANDALNKLIQRGQVFNAKQQEVVPRKRLSTGYRQLDQLFGGGLTLGALHEVQTPQPFSGESLIFKAALQHAQVNSHPVFWLNPPAQPFAPGLQMKGCRHTMLTNLSERELQWAAAQVLKELQQGVVLIWLSQPSADTIRQWQRALDVDSEVFALVICQPMDHEARAYSSRIRLNLDSGNLSFDILKRPGGWPARTLPEPLRAWS